MHALRTFAKVGETARAVNRLNNELRRLKDVNTLLWDFSSSRQMFSLSSASSMNGLSLSDFIQGLVPATRTFASSTDPVNVVMGNESGDLDSMVSAVLWAYAMTHKTDKHHLPLFNIPRQDVPLRKEAPWVFKEAGIDIQAVPCAEEVNLSALAASRRLRLILVDHNTPCADQLDLGSSVVGIVDHHEDEGKHMEASRKIEKVGSATTLVAAELLKASLVTPEVALLLQSAILLDTRNLNANEVHFLPLDREVASTLQEITGREPSKFYGELFTRRMDVSGVPLADLLRKDAKSVSMNNYHFYMSSLAGMSLEILTTNFPNWQQELLRCCKEKGWDLLIIMMAFTEGKTFNRHLVLAGGELVAPLRDYLSRSESKLELEPLSASSSSSTLAFVQRNSKASRKQVLPLVRQYVGSLKPREASSNSGTVVSPKRKHDANYER